MAITVLSVAFPFAAVGSRAVGGAEEILGALDAALVAAGQHSVVIACEGSETAGELIPVSASPARLDAEHRRWVVRQVQVAIERAVMQHPIDLIHMHGFDFFEYELPAAVPVLVTLHLPIGWYPERAWRTGHPRVRFQCVSHEQRGAWMHAHGKVAVIPNGVQLPALRMEQRQEYAVVMGRICPEKNAHEALEAATSARTPVFIAGQVFPYAEHQEYFVRRIEPLLGANSIGHRFLGPLDYEERLRVLAAAKCLLHPTLAPETSSLAAMEALAAGTPVIAYRSGALSGIIDEGVTGFLVRDRNEMAEAIRRVHTLRSEDCRRAAEQRFSRERMVRAYFELYEEMLCDREKEKMYA